jgi:hypothetical protein
MRLHISYSRSKKKRERGYGGFSLGSWNEAPLISREVLPETYFLSVIMAVDAQARPFLQFQASCLCGTL